MRDSQGGGGGRRREAKRRASEEVGEARGGQEGEKASRQAGERTAGVAIARSRGRHNSTVPIGDKSGLDLNLDLFIFFV